MYNFRIPAALPPTYYRYPYIGRGWIAYAPYRLTRALSFVEKHTYLCIRLSQGPDLLQEKTAGSPAAKNKKGIYVSVDPLGVLFSGRDERI